MRACCSSAASRAWPSGTRPAGTGTSSGRSSGSSGSLAPLLGFCLSTRASPLIAAPSSRSSRTACPWSPPAPSLPSRISRMVNCCGSWSGETPPGSPPRSRTCWPTPSCAPVWERRDAPTPETSPGALPRSATWRSTGRSWRWAPEPPHVERPPRPALLCGTRERVSSPLDREGRYMGSTLSQRIIDRLDGLDDVAEKVQPKVQEVIDKGGTTLRNALDGTWLGSPLHPVLQAVPVGSWTAAFALDAVDLVSSSKAVRNAADGALAVGVASGFAVAAVGLSDWRYLSGGSRRMGIAHGLLNSAGLVLNTASLLLRATGRRNAGRLAFLAGYSLNGAGAHVGGELSYGYGLRVNRNVFEWAGPDEFTPVLEESELPEEDMRRVEIDSDDGGKVGILLSRARNGEVCAISATCNHFSGPLEGGDREGDTVVCPWHKSRFDLCTGRVIDGPAVFPQSRYETRVRDGNIEVRAAEENVPRRVR